MTPPLQAPTLTIAIVTYCPDRAVLEATLASVRRAVGALGGMSVKLFIVDNTSDGERPVWLSSLVTEFDGELLEGHGNVGFGRGHNLVLPKVGDFHLCLNPDVELAEDSLREALAFMGRYPECGLLTPGCSWPDGERQYLCKRYPSLLDLLLRGFAPQSVKKVFRKRLERYEMRDMIAGDVVWDPEIVSGCFMFFRGGVFGRLGGFDPAYFLYFEDFDLSLRTRAFGRIAYVPAVRIIHHGGRAAGKGMRHIRMFGRSALTFFNKFGWRVL